MGPNLRFRSIKLKELYRSAVVHNECDRDALRWTVQFNQYFLTRESGLDVVHCKGNVLTVLTNSGTGQSGSNYASGYF
jgi:hypothetical protein